MSAFSHISLSNEPQMTGESNLPTAYYRKGRKKKHNYLAKDVTICEFEKAKVSQIRFIL